MVGGYHCCASWHPHKHPREGSFVPSYVFAVKVAGTVRVRAADEFEG
jgi:hypothetical protein